MREQDAARRLVEVLPLNDISLFVLDEFQNLCRSSSLSPRLAAASFLITIQNGRVCPVVVTCTNQLDDIFAAEDALDKRKGGLAYLAPFALRTEADRKLTRAFVRQFMGKLPFRETCDLYSKD